jgi:glutamyl-tRNA synthetase
MSATRKTRLAPSPTGALHLGNARTFLINWALARRNGWRIVLRIDDLDGPRIKQGADRGAIEDLQWLGIDWDEGPYYQSADLSRYEQAIRTLTDEGLTYPCAATRRQIEAALSAPHGDEHELRYPGLYRPPAGPPIAEDEDTAIRVIVPDEPIAFVDELLGPQAVNVQQQVGDFVISGKNGLPAYQLTVVVDDAAQGITDIVRGDDLLDSTARQHLLYRSLGLYPMPRYWHLPLVVGPDGRRLAKRHGDSRLSTYRQEGIPPEKIIGLMADWSGLGSDGNASRGEMDAAGFCEHFEIGRLPHRPAVLTLEDEAWLRSGCRS